MNLYEITTGLVGESYERAYAWAESEDDARRMFLSAYRSRDIEGLRLLLSDSHRPFVSNLSSTGFNDSHGFLRSSGIAPPPGNPETPRRPHFPLRRRITE